MGVEYFLPTLYNTNDHAVNFKQDVAATARRRYTESVFAVQRPRWGLGIITNSLVWRPDHQVEYAEEAYFVYVGRMCCRLAIIWNRNFSRKKNRKKKKKQKKRKKKRKKKKTGTFRNPVFVVRDGRVRWRHTDEFQRGRPPLMPTTYLRYRFRVNLLPPKRFCRQVTVCIPSLRSEAKKFIGNCHLSGLDGRKGFWNQLNNSKPVRDKTMGS